MEKWTGEKLQAVLQNAATAGYFSKDFVCDCRSDKHTWSCQKDSKATIKKLRKSVANLIGIRRMPNGLRLNIASGTRRRWQRTMKFEISYLEEEIRRVKVNFSNE